MNIANIGVGVFADLTKLSSGLQEGQSAVVAFAGIAASAFSTVSAAATAAALVIDDALDGIRISTGATGDALASLEGSFERVFAGVPDSAANASSAVAQLNVRTGATGVALEQLSTQVLTLSRITKSDLNATVTDSAKVFQSWGIAVGQQSATLDMVLRASQQTGVGVGTLLQTMVTAGPVFRAAGYDFATTAALLGGFEKAGVNGQRAIASLTAAFRFFSGKKGGGVNPQEGISQTIARIQELGPSAAASALGVKVFGRSAVDMIAAIQSGRLDVDALAKSIATGSETIESAAKATDGFTESLSILRNRVTQALEPFGTAILAAFNSGLLAMLEPSRALIAVLGTLAQVVTAVAVALSTRAVIALFLSAKALVANTLAAQAARVANVQYTAAVAVQAQAQFVAATAALNEARAETALTGSLVAQRAALAAVATAHAQATAATAAHTAAIQAASLSARAAAASMGILRGALAFFGGPIGLAITVALTAVSLGFFNAGKRAREAAAEAKQAADDFRAAIATMDEASFASAAAMTRQNYRTQGELIARQQQSIAQTQAMVERLRRSGAQGGGFAESKGVVQRSPALQAAEEGLRREQANLALLSRGMEGYAANVRAVREQEAALARQRAAMPDLNKDGPGRLPWEGDDKDSEKWWQKLASNAQNVRTIFEALRSQQEDTTHAGEALAGVLELAQSRVAGLGDAVTGELAEARSVLLKLISDLRSIDGLGFTVRMDVQQPTLTSAGGSDPFTQGGNNLIRKMIADGAQAEYWKIEEERQRQRANSTLAEQGVLYAFGDLAKRVAEAGQRAAELWGSLFEGAPRQVKAFLDAFRVTRDERAARVAAGEAVRPVFGTEVLSSLSGLVGAALTPLGDMLSSAFAAAKNSAVGSAVSSVGDAVGSIAAAPVPAAAAFMLALEALAPVLEALQPAFDALMVPVQMLAEAFGPLLTSLLKAFFPILKLLMIGFTYTAQVIGYVGGAIFKVIGEVISAIGDLISRVPGLGEEGQAIERFGRGLVGTSSELFALAEAMPGIREEIRALEWADAMDRVADGANRAARAMVNVVEGFKIAQYRFEATAAGGSTGGGGKGGGATGGKTTPGWEVAQQWQEAANGVRAVREQEAALATERANSPVPQFSVQGQRQELEAVEEQWKGILSTVIAVRDAEGELYRQRAIMQATAVADPNLLASAWDAFNRITEGVQGRISALGSTVTDELSTARGVIQALSGELRAIDGLGFSVRTELPSAPQRVIPRVSPTTVVGQDRQRRNGGANNAAQVQQTVVHSYNLGNVTIQAAPGEDEEALWDRLRALLDKKAKSQPGTRATVASLPR